MYHKNKVWNTLGILGTKILAPAFSENKSLQFLCIGIFTV